MKPNRRWNLCPVALLVLLLTCLAVSAQVSYWFQGWQRSGNAADAQAYFMLPGQGVNFTYGNNRVFINANGVLFATNALWATNWVGSNSMQAQITIVSNSVVTTSNTLQTQVTVVSNSLVTTSNVLQSQVTGLTNAFQTNAWHLNGNTLVDTNSFIGSVNKVAMTVRVNNTNVMLLDTNDDVVIGRGASAGGGQGTAVGRLCQASGLGALTMGFNSQDSGVGSVAIGNNVNVSGNQAVGIGAGNSVSAMNAIGIGGSATDASAVAIGFGSTASGDSSAALGPGATAAGFGAMATPFATANGILGIALGASVENNDGSLVANDGNALVTDDVANQFAAGYAGGFKLIGSGAGVSTDGPINSTNTINSYNATGNSFTYNAQANAGVAAVQSPLGNWGFLSLTNSQLINIAVSSTYYPITNFNYAATNRFGASYVRGELTNTLAGWYRIGFNVSIAAPTANDAVDADLLINGVVTEIIASHSTAPGGVPPKYVTLSASGIQHLSAGTRVGIGITDTTGTGNATILHSQLTIGSP